MLMFSCLSNLYKHVKNLHPEVAAQRVAANPENDEQLPNPALNVLEEAVDLGNPKTCQCTRYTFSSDATHTHCK